VAGPDWLRTEGANHVLEHEVCCNLLDRYNP